MLAAFEFMADEKGRKLFDPALKVGPKVSVAALEREETTGLPGNNRKPRFLDRKIDPDVHEALRCLHFARWLRDRRSSPTSSRPFRTGQSI